MSLEAIVYFYIILTSGICTAAIIKLARYGYTRLKEDLKIGQRQALEDWQAGVAQRTRIAAVRINQKGEKLNET